METNRTLTYHTKINRTPEYQTEPNRTLISHTKRVEPKNFYLLKKKAKHLNLKQKQSEP